MLYRRIRSAALLAAAGVLAAAAPASAHGLGAQDPNRPLPEYLWLGFKHLLAGWDHLLFILAIVLLAGGLWRATKLISLFVLGHSITLMLATTQEWTVSAQLVDVVIALSVLFVAVVGLRGRPQTWEWFGAVLFGVGLVHGLGLATRLLALGVSDNDLAWRVLLFNIGVELGQAVAVVAFVGAGALLVRLKASREDHRRPAFGVIAAAGAIGAAVLSLPGDPARSEAKQISAACSEAPIAAPAVNDAGHPRKQFYGPAEQPPTAQFQHVLGDGYVIVTYRPDIAAADLARLRDQIDRQPKAAIGGPAADQQEPLVATTARTRLTCSKVDVAAYLKYRDAWLKQIFGPTTG
jgi:hydrogenase/urease accessory protein HupE